MTMAVWNANKMSELKNFLYEYSIEICHISETNVKPCIPSLNITNYNIFRTDRLHHRGGGTAIFTKKHKKVSLYRTDTFRGFEETHIIIDQSNRRCPVYALDTPDAHTFTFCWRNYHLCARLCFTVLHILNHCPSFNTNRLHLFNSNNLPLTELLGNSPYCNFFTFLHEIDFYHLI